MHLFYFHNFIFILSSSDRLKAFHAKRFKSGIRHRSMEEFT